MRPIPAADKWDRRTRPACTARVLRSIPRDRRTRITYCDTVTTAPTKAAEKSFCAHPALGEMSNLAVTGVQRAGRQPRPRGTTGRCAHCVPFPDVTLRRTRIRKRVWIGSDGMRTLRQPAVSAFKRTRGTKFKWILHPSWRRRSPWVHARETKSHGVLLLCCTDFSTGSGAVEISKLGYIKKGAIRAKHG